MDYKFKIGDKVILKFGGYSGTIQEAVIIGETKTLWKTDKYSFDKMDNRIRGHSNSYHPSCAVKWDASIVNDYNRKVLLRRARKFAEGLLNRGQEDSLIEWYNSL